MRTVRPDHITGQRQREDGTWTFATEEHDAKWYWPEGTVVEVQGHPELGMGIVKKENSTTVWAEFEGERRGEKRFKVSKPALIRVTGATAGFFKAIVEDGGAL